MPIIYRTSVYDRKTGKLIEQRDPVEVSEEQLYKQFLPLAEYFAKKIAIKILYEMHSEDEPRNSSRLNL